MTTKIQQTGEKVVANVERVIVGKHHEVRLALVALLCRGHLLIEDVPGTGKTVLAKAIARSLGCSFRRIQFTPDLLPSDVTGPVDLQPEDPGVRVPARPDHGPGRPRRRDQPGDAEDPVEPARVHGGAPGDDRRHDLRRCPTRSSSSRPRTRSSTRARSPCRRPSSTGSCSGSGSATRSRSRRSSSSTSRSGPIRSTSSRSCARSTSCARCRTAIREIYVDSSVADYIVRLVNGTRNHPDVYLGASPRGSIALYRAGQALAGLLGRDYVIPDDVKALAEPALAHRLIIKTSSSIHDVQAGQVVRELLETTPIDGDPADRRPGRERSPPAAPRARSATRRDGADRGRRMSRTDADDPSAPAPRPRRDPRRSPRSRPGCRSSSTSSTSAILVVGGSYVLTRLGLSDLEAGYAVSQLTRPRRRPAPGHVHAAQHEPAPEAVARGPQPDDAAGRPARAGRSRSGRGPSGRGSSGRR